MPVREIDGLEVTGFNFQCLARRRGLISHNEVRILSNSLQFLCGGLSNQIFALSFQFVIRD